MTPPRIGLNLLWLRPGEAGGAEEYALRLLRALDVVAGDALELTLLVTRRFPEAHPALAERFPTAAAPIDGASRPVRIAAESTWLASVAASRRLHVVHHLNNVVPWVRTRPSVLTIHDLRPLALPATIGRTQGAYLRMRLRPSARAARAITTPSSFVRGTVIDLLGIEPDRVHVVSAPVVDAPIDPIEPTPSNGRMLLYPAITNPHKNHRVLLEAFAQVVAVHPDTTLVLTGAAGSAEADVARSIDALGLAGHVRRLGRVPPGELSALYRTAAALVYPSTYEGFGLPLAEAMVAGCPVIAADATALPEVVGTAGILVPPLAVDAWARAMCGVLEDDGLRAKLVAAGPERVRAFSLEAAARRQLDAYRAALEGPRPSAG